MDKQKSVIIAIVVVILVVVLAVVLASNRAEDNEVNEPNNNQVQNQQNQVEESDFEPTEEELPVSEENVLIINETGFTPETLFGEAGKRVFITFEATDGQRHIIASEDPALADIFLVVIEEDEEPKSVAFMAPEAGTYNFYVDEAANTGTLVIE